MWHYHTHLQATHAYASQWWSWPLNLFPVWYFVAYEDQAMATIYASGNPVLFWAGAAAVLLTAWQAWSTRDRTARILTLAYAALWLPYALSPRIMFLYHYSPAVPVVCLALGSQLNQLLGIKQGKLLVMLLLLAVLAGFIVVFPFLTGIPVPRDWINVFFMTNISKNPFAEGG